MREGAFTFIEIPVRDLPRAANFYAGLFEWSFEVERETQWFFAPSGPGPMGVITTERPVANGVQFGVHVDDVEEVVRKAIELGGAPTGQRRTRDVGDFVELVDLDGNHFWVARLDFRTPQVPYAGADESTPD